MSALGIRITIIVLIAASVVGCAHSPSEFSHRVFLTTHLDDQSQPADTRDSFSFEDGQIYVYVRFYNIPAVEHDFHIEAFDGSGALVWVGGRTFTPKQRSWNQWSWHPFHPVTETPGDWKIEIYLDGTRLDRLIVPVAEHTPTFLQRVPS